MGRNTYINSDYQGNSNYQWTKGYPGAYQMGVPMAGQEYSPMAQGGRYGTPRDELINTREGNLRSLGSPEKTTNSEGEDPGRGIEHYITPVEQCAIS